MVIVRCPIPSAGGTSTRDESGASLVSWAYMLFRLAHGWHTKGGGGQRGKPDGLMPTGGISLGADDLFQSQTHAEFVHDTAPQLRAVL